MRKIVDLICEYCNKNFSREYKNVYRSKKTFCSIVCRGKAQFSQIEISCALCSKKVYKVKAELKKNNFCSHSCSATFSNNFRKANGFSIKGKTKIVKCSKCNINDIEVSAFSSSSISCCDLCFSLIPKKLTKGKNKIQKTFDLKCATCGNDFTSLKKDTKNCSKICVTKYKNDSGVLSALAVKRILDGYGPIGAGTKCDFIFNQSTIKCDSILEYSSLEYFTSKLDIISIERCDFSIPYVYEDKNYKYIPDFIFNTKSDGYILECKGVVGKKLNEKWRNYLEKAKIKKVELEKYAKLHNLTPIWFSPEINEYRKCYVKNQKLFKNKPV